MNSTTLFPGRYVQGADALQRLGKEVSRLGDHGFVICDPFVYGNLLPGFRPGLEGAIKVSLEKFEGESSDEEIARLVGEAKALGANVVVGIGGGKTADTAKAVAHALKTPVAIVPTLASTDAPCSALSVIYTPEGKFKRYLVLDKNPDLVLVDTKVVVNAPPRFLVAGMGDALATWFEAESCRQSHAANMSGDVGSMTAYALAKLCFETLLEHGVAAKLACEARSVVPALEHVVEACTLLSGLGFESGGLASAHAIHNGLTVLEATHAYFHGELVTIGTLASLVLTGQSKEMVDKAFSFCESVGLPTTLAGIGLKDVEDAALMQVATLTCAEGETIHNEPFHVTPEKVLYALKTMDAIGRSRNNFK
jgi:glycerol dehydrogenase